MSLFGFSDTFVNVIPQITHWWTSFPFSFKYINHIQYNYLYICFSFFSGGSSIFSVVSKLCLFVIIEFKLAEVYVFGGRLKKFVICDCLLILNLFMVYSYDLISRYLLIYFDHFILLILRFELVYTSDVRSERFE